jgi:hypothetical protein
VMRTSSSSRCTVGTAGIEHEKVMVACTLPGVGQCDEIATIFRQARDRPLTFEHSTRLSPVTAFLRSRWIREQE